MEQHTFITRKYFGGLCSDIHVIAKNNIPIRCDFFCITFIAILLCFLGREQTHAQDDSLFILGKWKVTAVLYTLTSEKEYREEVYRSCINQTLKITRNGFSSSSCDQLKERFPVKTTLDSQVLINTLLDVYSDKVVEFIQKHVKTTSINIYKLNLPLENETLKYPLIFCRDSQKIILYIHDFLFFLEKVK